LLLHSFAPSQLFKKSGKDGLLNETFDDDEWTHPPEYWPEVLSRFSSLLLEQPTYDTKQQEDYKKATRLSKFSLELGALSAQLDHDLGSTRNEHLNYIQIQ